MTGGAFYTTPGSSPPTVSVLTGTPVAWTNTSGVFHNVTFANPAAAGGVSGGAVGNIGEHTSGTNSRQFGTPGPQNFQCTLHSNMTGVVIVQ
jgi:plastocyanin